MTMYFYITLVFFFSVQDWNIYFFYFLILMVLLKGMKLIGIKTKQMNAYN